MCPDLSNSETVPFDLRVTFGLNDRFVWIFEFSIFVCNHLDYTPREVNLPVWLFFSLCTYFSLWTFFRPCYIDYIVSILEFFKRNFSFVSVFTGHWLLVCFRQQDGFVFVCCFVFVIFLSCWVWASSAVHLVRCNVRNVKKFVQF